MQCYGRLDRHAEAAEVFERCRRTLGAPFGVAPSPETRAIYERLLSPR